MTDPLWRLARIAAPSLSRFALGVVLGGLATGASIALLGTAAWLLARAAEHPPITALGVAVVATRALGVTRGVARYLERLVTHDAALRALARVRAAVYARLARTEPLRRFRSGDLVSRLVNDVDATRDLLVRGLAPPLVAVLTGGVTAGGCAWLFLPGGALLAAGLLLGGVAVPVLALRLTRRAGRRQAEARGELSGAVLDCVHGAEDLVAYGAMDRAVARAEAADTELTRVARADARTLGVIDGLLVLLTGGTVWAVLLLGVLAVEGRALDAVTLAVVVLTALAAFEVVAPLPAVAARLSQTRAAATRLFETLDTPPAVRRAPRPRPLPAGPQALRIEDLRVRYAATEPWVLDGLNLTLPPGGRVAVVGPSGAGKSTLASVLLRFHDPDHGRVRLGDVDAVEASVADWRRAVVGAEAEAHVFDSTIAANLRLARPEAPEEALWEALERAGLAAEVRAMPHGLDTAVGARGAALSGGMRTRLAVARALLCEPRILVLDEPTAHLDAETRDAVLEDVLRAGADCSVLLITHDAACLAAMDEVYALHDGRLTIADRPGPAPHR